MAKKSQKPPAKPDPSPSDSDSDASDASTSSDDTVEDEHGAELTPALDAAILRTLARIKRGDGVYGGEELLAAELRAAEARAGELGLRARARVVEDKPYLLKDLHRARLLNGESVEDEPDAPALPTNVEMERAARAEALSAFHALAESDDSESDDGNAAAGLVRREKDADEAEEDDEEYRRFLLEMGGGEDAVRAALGMGDQPVSHIRAESDDEDVDGPAAGAPDGKKSALSEAERQEARAERAVKRAKADDDFLMNYILNRGWIDRSGKHVPTYEEIVGRPKEDDAEAAEAAEAGDEGEHPWGKLDEDDDFDEAADEFETAYNFRFEEPLTFRGSSTILTHPRQIATLVRRDDDTRRLKRQAREERKAAERAALEDEVRRQKGAKRREAERTMASLRAELGEGGGLDWAEIERAVEGEFDEAEWERVVGAMLERKAEMEDEEKPTWSDDEGEGDYEMDDDDVAAEQAAGPVDNAWADDWDGPINMDADFADEPAKKKGRSKKDKGKGRETEKDKEKLEALSVADKANAAKKAMDEYRALDHEDMIGDLATRFKYTRAPPTTYGLTPAEILMATDAELNAFVPLKYTAAYRRRTLGRAGIGLGHRARELKHKLRARKWGEDDEGAAEAGPAARARDAGWAARPEGQGEAGGAPGEKKKRIGKKQRNRIKAAAAYQAAAAAGGDAAQGPAGALPTAAGGPEREAAPVAADVPAGEGAGEGEGKKRKRRKKRHSEAAAV